MAARLQTFCAGRVPEIHNSNNADESGNNEKGTIPDSSFQKEKKEGMGTLRQEMYEKCPEANSNRTNLIVNYLPPSMSQEEMRSLFSKVGNLTSCKLIRDRNSGQSLGYGFVNYSSPQDAALAIKLLNRTRVRNKVIKVSLARPSCESIKGANLYICGLPKSMTEEELEHLFQSCGKIITSRILCDSSTNQSKGVGFIRFDQRHEAEMAIQQFNGYRIDGTSEMPLTVKFANMPTSIKAVPTSSSANDQGASDDSSLFPKLTSLLDLSPLGFGTNTLASILAGPSLLNGPNADFLALLNATNQVSGNSLVESIGVPFTADTTRPLRRVGGPVHNHETHRFRFNPIDGCAVQVAVNPFDRVKLQHIGGLTSSPVTANGLRLVSKYPDYETQASLNAAATALGVVSTPSVNGLEAQNPETLGFGSHQWTTGLTGAAASNLGIVCENGTTLSSFFQSQDRQKDTNSPFPLMLLTDPTYPPFGTCPTVPSDPVPDILSSITNNHLIYGAIDANPLHILTVEKPLINPLQLQPSQKSMPGNSGAALVRVDGLSCDAKEAIVSRLFSPFPGVISVYMGPSTIYNPLQKQSELEKPEQTFSAFVLMSDVEQAKLASQYLNGCTLQNRLLQVMWEPITSTSQSLSAIQPYDFAYPNYPTNQNHQWTTTN